MWNTSFSLGESQTRWEGSFVHVKSKPINLTPALLLVSLLKIAPYPPNPPPPSRHASYTRDVGNEQTGSEFIVPTPDVWYALIVFLFTAELLHLPTMPWRIPL
jgi:hypothetical protein